MTDTNPSPDLICVVATAQEEVEATGATLRVAIQGASLLTGDIALVRVRELIQCVADLKRLGLSDADIGLESVESANGSRASAVTYVLSVRCPGVELLGEALGVLTSQKHIQVRQIRWTYPAPQDALDRLLDRAIAEANRKAQRMATGLGVRIVGVHRAQPWTEDTEGPPAAYGAPQMARARQAAPEWSDFGSQISHRKTLTASVSVSFRVAGFAPPQPEV